MRIKATQTHEDEFLNFVKNNLDMIKNAQVFTHSISFTLENMSVSVYRNTTFDNKDYIFAEFDGASKNGYISFVLMDMSLSLFGELTNMFDFEYKGPADVISTFKKIIDEASR
ncbi:hypothetical protein Ab1vBOLIVR5_gp97c [Agrobacterium phage OLIVR5]|uniref:Uncharacterized protein n=1 Tax=Agrobacterium phage OLIVR5 TaxID=2723773 RepID=A0A858MYW4_9CAUD|nr:hypothetical protein KNU99_gp097 [Agrobacterium phage OLIVR5]QIW87745.1 hypothetical protein Ab1vBOLIVR5_gp97c [Agrobacterium phage OLIVR5]QIW88007.1 hypothetical protein Ab1vBOLIVR6_gp100c [Agrobacterium phage OLIVR6]